MTRLITLLTDFGLQDAYAGVLHGVIRGIAPAATPVDLSHQVPPQDARAGAFLLLTSYSYFPAGTIHVAVVDPGVGTARKIVAADAGGYTFVGPDNGVLRWAIDHAGGARKIVSVESAAFRLSHVSQTFHGRDVMAPAAAHLANGVELEALGPPLASLSGDPFPVPVERDGVLLGEVVHVDRFGNCVTNLPPSIGTIEVAGRRIERRETYGAVSPGEALVLAGSHGFLEIAITHGSAARTLGIARGDVVRAVSDKRA